MLLHLFIQTSNTIYYTIVRNNVKDASINNLTLESFTYGINSIVNTIINWVGEVYISINCEAVLKTRSNPVNFSINCVTIDALYYNLIFWFSVKKDHLPSKIIYSLKPNVKSNVGRMETF